jgi:hypothetical protein
MAWLQAQLAASSASWQIVYFHHPPYSSSGSTEESMLWPFTSWGADAVISGHKHNYERIFTDGNVYFINGLGAQSKQSFGSPASGSQVRYSEDFGAMRVDANDDAITFEFINLQGSIIDTFTKYATDSSVDVRIAQSSDDVEEKPSGTMSLSSSDLELGIEPKSGGTETVGLRFQNMGIPQGATIKAAYLEFETDELGSSEASVSITAEASDNAAAFTNTSFDLTGRPATTASVGWDIPVWSTTGQKHQSIDLSSVVQEVVSRAGWSVSNSMVFIITGSGTRTAESYDGEQAAAPLLHVEYMTDSGLPDIDSPTVPGNVSATAVTANRVDVSWTASTDVSGGIVAGYQVYRSDIGLLATVTGLGFSDTTVVADTSYDYTVSAFDNATPLANESAQSSPPANAITPPAGTGILDVRIAQSSDDVEENPLGKMSFSSTDLELGIEPKSDGTETVGLRFQNMSIPQGATITAAYLEFETDELGSSEASVSITAEASDNAAAFTNTSFDLTGRPATTASVGWDIPVWSTISQKHQSTDLSSVVQEIVSRPGWSVSNSMVFIITGSGTRTAESYDGEQAQPRYSTLNT